jgi:hypothetical protein
MCEVDALLRLQASITERDDRLLGWLYDHEDAEAMSHSRQPSSEGHDP